MDIMVNSELLKSMRLEKSWSQEKLAASAGLSLRTVQRVENTGTASLETKLALASALGIKSEVLSVQPSFRYQPSEDAKRGFLGALVGLVCSYTGITIPLVIGAIDATTAGFWYGGVGAMIGISCAVMGVIDKRIHPGMRKL